MLAIRRVSNDIRSPEKPAYYDGDDDVDDISSYCSLGHFALLKLRHVS